MSVLLVDHLTGRIESLRLDNTKTIAIPPGISHGFYTKEGVLLEYALTVEYTGTDEFEWNAYSGPPRPSDWPSSEWVIRSERDRLAPSFSEFVRKW